MSDSSNIKREPTDDHRSEHKEESSSSSAAAQPMDTSSQQASTADVKPSSSSSLSNQPAKRTFVPNLAVERGKREVKQEPETTGDNKPARRQTGPNLNSARGGRGGRGGARGGGSANIIQSHSIFEAGPAESSRRYAGRDAAGDSGYSYVGSVGRGETSTKMGEKGMAPGDDDVHQLRQEDHMLIEDVLANDPSVFIKLKVEGGKEAESKQQTDEQNRTTTNLLNSSAQGKLVLFQLPENLHLAGLGEGLVGKLRFRQSGRVELCLNNNQVTLNVTPSVSGQFLQDATVIELATSGSVGGPETGEIIKQQSEYANTLVNLGRVENKIVCSPKFF